MKNGETVKTKNKRPVAKKGKRGLNPRAVKAAAVFFATNNKSAAARAVGVDPRHSDRLLNTFDAQTAMARNLQEIGLGPDRLARKIKDLSEATVFVTAEAAEMALFYSRDSVKRQIEMFDPITLMPRRGAPGAIADTKTQLTAVEMAAKYQGIGQGDPEYGKKMFEEGARQASGAWLRLLAKLKPTLTAEQLAMVEEEVRTEGKNYQADR